MTQDDVSTAAGEAGVAHVFGRELDGQATIEAVQRLDTVEHLAVTLRGCGSSRHLVPTVGPPFADRVTELTAARQRLGEFVPHRRGGLL
jgi:hypothetical protein